MKMAEDNITPAVNFQQEEMPNEMTAAEFQQRLYAWFEDRGLLSELRAHLRKQMIGVLKDTAVGRTVSGQQKQVSPKLQALNLLIAEFLLQQEYHYSLSVFSTEVPLISVLPEFPGLTMNCSTGKTENGKKWLFSEKDMWDILETLGIQRDTDEGKTIFNTYYNNGIHREPLLTCIVRMLHTMKSKSRTSITSEVKDVENTKVQSLIAPENNKSEPWLKTVHDLLSANNVSTQSLEELKNLLKRLVAAENKRIKDDAREEFLKLQMTLQLQTARKEEEQRKKFALMQKSIDIEKGKLDSDKNNRQVKINEFEQRVQRHREVLRERYQVLHVRERDVHEREQQLRQREGFLNAQQQNLETGYENLYREQRTVSDLQEKLQRELREKQKAAKNDAEFLRDLQEECKNMRNQISDTQEAVLNVTSKTVVENEQPISVDLDIRDAEQALVKGLIRQLQIENSGLRTLNSEQQFRIDELSQRATLLMHDLENSHAAAVANRPLVRSGILSAPPLAAPDAQAPSRFGGGSNSGAGEEGYRPTLPTSPTEFRHYPNIRDARRRVPSRRLSVHSSSSSDDHSPTNDVLQEARERLKRLEKESEEVDRHYRQFRSRQSQIDHHHHFYPRNLSRLQPFGSYSVNNGESSFQNQQATRSSNLNFNPEAVPHMFAKYQTHGNTNEPSGSQSVSRSRCPDCPLNNHRDTAIPGDNEAPCCSNFGTSQKKKMDLSQLVEWHFNQAITCMANNQSISDISLERENQQEHNDAEASTKEDREDERQFDNQSAASSGILGEMLAAGTSGVSLSDIEASDEKSESQHENPKD